MNYLNIRALKTSDLIAALVNPAVLRPTLKKAGERDDDPAVDKALDEVIDEIDRRIPVPPAG
jgi:hypothetical protein